MKSLENIEKSLEERLDPKRRIIGEAQLKEHEQNKKQLPASKIFRIEFSESLPEKSKSFLNERLPEIIDFPKKFGFNIKSAGHLLRFVDKATYEAELGTHLPKNVSLPASRIKYISNTRSFIVMIIIPEKLDTSETIINITRNLFSKLYGNIFLDEKILSQEFYRQKLSVEKQITASVPEILDLASELNLPSESLDKHCERIAKSYRLSIEKQGTEIRKKLTYEWRDKWKGQGLTTEEQHTIDSMFAEFIKSLPTNHEQFINSMIENVKKLNTHLHYILPHERVDYENFEKTHIKHYMRSVFNKLEEISSLADFIEELYSELDNFPKETNLRGISTQILLRMQQLRREKKVIKFYVPEMPMDNELERVRKKFPLVLIKMIPKGTPLKDWSKTVKRMEKHYSESIYSKLYLALHCLSILTNEKKDSKEDSIKKVEAIKLLKNLLATIKYRTTEIKTKKSALGVLLGISEQSVPNSKTDEIEHRQAFPFDEFKTAWKYFIASVLTLIYYKESTNSSGLPQGFNAENYTNSILEYVNKQCSRGINHFHIVKLLWLIYDEKLNSDSLKFLLFCLQNPQEILCFILNRVMCPQSVNSSLERRIEKLHNYRKAWITAFQNRLEEA